MIHTIIFDIGGTLIESKNLFEELAKAFNNDTQKISLFLEKQFFKIYANLNEPFIKVTDIITKVLVEASIEFGLIDISADAAKIYERVFIQESTLFDDTQPVLTRLNAAKIRIVALSDADAEILYKELDIFNIRKHFDRVWVSSEIGAYKPSDKTVNVVLQDCQKPVSGILVVGDSKVDFITAQKMGAKFALINRHNLFYDGPDYKISSLRQLLAIIDAENIQLIDE